MNEFSSRTAAQLSMLVNQLKSNPEYMAWVFFNYQKLEKISEEQLLSSLNTSLDSYLRLALCKRPSGSSSDFSSQVRQIAEYAKVEPTVLANLIRQVESLQTLSSKPDTEKESQPETTQLRTGLLAAARDRTEGEEHSEDNVIKPPDNEEDEEPGEKGR